MSDNMRGETIYDEGASIWRDPIRYVDLNTYAMGETNHQKQVRQLPLFLLGNAFYPQGETYLHVYEMKYRTMMFNVAKSDNLFGYIHTDRQTGQIASIGTLCRITETELLEDGRQYVALEGVSRFEVRKITKTLPYMVAEVELDYQDEMIPDKKLQDLELSVYDSLKYYMRLLRAAGKEERMAPVVSQATKKTKPTRFNLDDFERRTNFSFAICNMIQISQEKESQLLLQTSDVKKRLEALKLILSQASDFVAEKLIEQNIITAGKRDEIKTKTYTSDDDDDILPDDIVENNVEAEKDEWDISNVM